MKGQLGYGQPLGSVAQTAFIVPDLEAACLHWARNLGAGPFFVLPHLLAPGQTYRGEESRADVKLAALGDRKMGPIAVVIPSNLDKTVVNVTLPGHSFYRGMIMRTAWQHGGRWYITTVGLGNNEDPMNGLNNLLGRPDPTKSTYRPSSVMGSANEIGGKEFFWTLNVTAVCKISQHNNDDCSNYNG